MDIIILGKASFNRTDAPELVYCGQDRGAAQEALRKAANERRLKRFYELDPEPHRPLSTSQSADTGAQPAPKPDPQEKKAPKK